MRTVEADVLIDVVIKKSWNKIAPFWPLERLVAVNPLQGFEDLSIEAAMIEGAVLFQQKELPKSMELVNRVTIKWLQAFFDDGQAIASMPNRTEGFYSSWKTLAYFDMQIHGGSFVKKQWLLALPACPNKAIEEALLLLDIALDEQELFLTLLLSTLPGWASYIKYRTDWAQRELRFQYPVTQADYLAMRLIIAYLLWEEARTLLTWYHNSKEIIKNQPSPMGAIKKAEFEYQIPLLEKFLSVSRSNQSSPEVQIVFCLDVRSEPFRRVLESKGNYETFGCAGFFGIPLLVEDGLMQEFFPSCPVFVLPKHVLLAELNLDNSCLLIPPTLTDIPFERQCKYAEEILSLMGLTKNFAPLLVICGHGSITQNNPHAALLGCGACGGRSGGSNARVLATILNNKQVREYLCIKGIVIPDATYCIALEHNTTTDIVTIYDTHIKDLDIICKVNQLKLDLEHARHSNSQWRAEKMGFKGTKEAASLYTYQCSLDSAQVRPEWGLANNTSFIVAPRSLTKAINLEGRAFLHSYDYSQDKNGASLTTILTGPMVVAQWINSQYLFSTLDNVAYGAGSKITLNITGKIGVMQGNASDLMHGLPLQAVYSSDIKPYHQPLRLMTVVYALRIVLDAIIQKNEILKKIFGNGWVTLVCIEPHENLAYFLQRDLIWK